MLLVPVRLSAQAVQPGPVELLASHASAPPLTSDLSGLDAPGIVIQTVNSPGQEESVNKNNARHESPPSVCKQAELHRLDAVKNFTLKLDAALNRFLVSVSVKKP